MGFLGVNEWLFVKFTITSPGMLITGKTKQTQDTVCLERKREKQGRED